MTRRIVVTGVVLLALGFSPRFASASIIVGGSLFVEQDGNVVVVEYLGDFADFTHSLFLAQPANGFGTIFISNGVLGSPGDEFDLGFYTAGTELIFGLFVSNTANTFFTGPGTANPDGIAHAQVFTDPLNDIDPLALATLLPTWAPGDGIIVSFEDLHALDPEFDGDFNDLVFSLSNVSSVPEPTTLLLIGTGAVGLLVRSRRKNRKK